MSKANIVEVSEIDQINLEVTKAIRRIVECERANASPMSDTFVIASLQASADTDDEDESYGTISATLRARKEAWTVPGVAKLTTLSRQHLYKLAKAGRMPSHKVGGAVRFDPKQIADWWDASAIGAASRSC